MLHDASGAFCGFIMKKLDTTNELRELYKYPPREFEGITLKHKLVIAQNICAVIAGVHRAGYVFGDFNPMNIGVNLKRALWPFLTLTLTFAIRRQTRFSDATFAFRDMWHQS